MKYIYLALIFLIVGALISFSVMARFTRKEGSITPITGTKTIVANSRSSNTAITVKTEPLQVKQINNRGDKAILPLKQQITAGKETAIVTTEFKEEIKNDLSKYKFNLYAGNGSTYGGATYEFYNIGDFNANIGLGSSGIIYTIGYTVRPSIDLFVGGTTEISTDLKTKAIVGIGLRL